MLCIEDRSLDLFYFSFKKSSCFSTETWVDNFKIELIDIQFFVKLSISMNEIYLVDRCNIESVIFCFHNLFPSFPLCFQPICSQITIQNNITTYPDLKTSVTSLNLPSFCFQLKHFFIHGLWMCLPQCSKQRSKGSTRWLTQAFLFMCSGDWIRATASQQPRALTPCSISLAIFACFNIVLTDIISYITIFTLNFIIFWHQFFYFCSHNKRSNFELLSIDPNWHLNIKLGNYHVYSHLLGFTNKTHSSCSEVPFTCRSY